MSDSSKSTPTPKSAAAGSTTASSKSDAAKPSDSTSSAASNGAASSSEGGKSSREAVGGAGAVHYGFFSNVKTPQYRSGWDEIWAKGSKESGAKKEKPAPARKPVSISLELDELPPDIQAGLAEAARAKLRKSRINYDNRTRAGAITWRIACDVRR